MMDLFEKIVRTEYRQSFLWRFFAFAVTMAIIYNFKNDEGIRSALIYGPTAYMIIESAKRGEIVSLFSYLWGILHGLCHLSHAFIDQHGANDRHSPFWDVTIHLMMMIHAFILIAKYPATPTERNRLNIVKLFLLTGSIVNTISSFFQNTTGFWFVHTSIFQAFSTGCFLFSHLMYTEKRIPFYFTIFGLFLIVTGGNWVVFYLTPPTFLGDAFVNRYFESLFIVSTWVYHIIT